MATTLQHRRYKHIMITMHKIHNNTAPKYLTKLLPPELGHTQQHIRTNHKYMHQKHAHKCLDHPFSLQKYTNRTLYQKISEHPPLPLLNNTLTTQKHLHTTSNASPSKCTSYYTGFRFGM